MKLICNFNIYVSKQSRVQVRVRVHAHRTS